MPSAHSEAIAGMLRASPPGLLQAPEGPSGANLPPRATALGSYDYLRRASDRGRGAFTSGAFAHSLCAETTAKLLFASAHRTASGGRRRSLTCALCCAATACRSSLAPRSKVPLAGSGRARCEHGPEEDRPLVEAGGGGEHRRRGAWGYPLRTLTGLGQGFDHGSASAHTVTATTPREDVGHHYWLDCRRVSA